MLERFKSAIEEAIKEKQSVEQRKADFAEKNERKNQAGRNWISRKNFQVIQKILPEMTGVASHKKTGKNSRKKQWLRPQNFSPCRIHRVKNYGHDTHAISVMRYKFSTHITEIARLPQIRRIHDRPVSDL